MNKVNSRRAFGDHRRLVSAVVAVVAAFLCGSVLTGCESTQVQITSQPSLFPTFSAAVTDYVSRCDASQPVQLNITAPADTTVSVDGQPGKTGTFTAQVTRAVGQKFSIVVTTGGTPFTHYVRCLPADFPTWTTERNGSPQSEWYAVDPLTPGTFPIVTKYVAIFDTNGVPVWWRDAASSHPIFFTYLSNGHVAWARNGGGVEERRLDGSLVRSIDTFGSPSDFHEVVLLPNGHYLLITGRNRSGVDLTSIGGPANGTIVDQLVQEVTASGSLVWSWDTFDHIPVAEMDGSFLPPTPPASYDVYHMNSVEPDGDNVVLSYRHLDAVFKVNKTSGQIVYKLGGTLRPESLSIVNDPVFASGGNFGGQHDARVLPDGSVTIHDNGTNKNRAPRAVRYQINLATRAATLLEQITDPAAPSSGCCGSARKLPGGNWVASWGFNPLVTELTSSGSRVFGLTFDNGRFSYRAIPIPFGQLSRDALRAGMDAQHP